MNLYAKKLFNSGWSFNKASVGATIEQVEKFDFQPVDIPHDWLIYDANNLYESAFGFYKKIYDAGEKPAESVRLYFEGVYMDSTVYINRRRAFDWKYGYSSFEADISEFITAGENEIIVLVRHVSPNTRWYSGAGIFRDVYLLESGKSHIETDGVYFSAKKHNLEWRCTVSANISNPPENGKLKIGIDGLYSETFPVCGKSFEAEFSVNVPENEIWSLENPRVHKLTAELICGGDTLDEYVSNIGFREIRFDAESGFYLNDKHVKLHGVCLHHDLGSLGAAFNKDEMKRRLLMLKEMGANAVRTSHNMPAKGLMELCDELGFLVDSEAYDIWERPKTEFDNARFFDECYQKDVKSWVCRDRNHPSVIMWSIGNEIYDTHGSPRGYEVTEMLSREVKKYDPHGNALVTFGSNYLEWDNTIKCADLLDVVGYNYGERLYEKHHAAHPDWKIYGSETTAGVKSRGVYHFPLSSVYLTHDDMQCSSLPNCRAGKSAETAGEVIEKDLSAKLCAGMFIWTGIDYIGEPTPYSTKNSYYGPIDTAGIKKDQFWLYKAAWTEKPVLHIMPYWDYNEGQLIDICAYTNLPEVELFVNGKSLGKRKPEKWLVSWQSEYHCGEIKAVGYTEDGAEITDSRRSFGDSETIVLTCNKTEIAADGISTAAVEISVTDKDENPVENARDYITVSVEGGRLIGFDNGDSTDYDSYKSNSRKLFSGKATAIIASSDKAGTISVKAGGAGLKSASTTINALPAAAVIGASYNEKITGESAETIVPIRKIELKTVGGHTLTAENNAATITAEIFPKNADGDEIKWSVVGDSGLSVVTATIEKSGSTARVTACGDGHFRVRCTASNGKPFPEVISELEFSASGLGTAETDAYSFVRAGLFSSSDLPLDEVSEGGVSIEKEHNRLTFDKINFGADGSDKISVSMLHWFTNDPINFRVYADGKLLGEYEYKQDFLWQTYKKQEYSLPCRLRNVHSVSFEVDKTEQKLYFGGFSFIESNRAYSGIPATDSDLVHGDTYIIGENRIEHIGNNVIVSFTPLNFSEGVSALCITGKTHHENDTIHVMLTAEDGTVVRGIAEFPQSENAVSITVPISGIKGTAKAELIFLPGCDFDLESVQFTAEKK